MHRNETFPPHRPTPIHVFTDFDGTLTQAGGEKVFDTYLPGGRWLVDVAITNHEDRGLRAFLAQHPEFQIDQSVVHFLKALLNNDNATVHIISRNFAAYVQALLKIAGFSEALINHIDLVAREQLGAMDNDKGKAVNYILQTVKPEYSFVFDDNSDDLDAMAKALSAKELNFAPTCKEPGCFQWDKHLEIVENMKFNVSVVQPFSLMPPPPRQTENNQADPSLNQNAKPFFKP